MQVKKQQLEPHMEQWMGSKLGKEYIKTVCCYPVYLTYKQSTSCEILGWIKDKLKSRLLGKYQQPQNTADTTLMAESEEELKSLLIWVKRRMKKLA